MIAVDTRATAEQIGIQTATVVVREYPNTNLPYAVSYAPPGCTQFVPLASFADHGDAYRYGYDCRLRLQAKHPRAVINFRYDER